MTDMELLLASSRPFQRFRDYSDPPREADASGLFVRTLLIEATNHALTYSRVLAVQDGPEVVVQERLP